MAKSSTPFDRCLQSLSLVINGRDDGKVTKAERAIDEYVTTVRDDVEAVAALDELGRRVQTDPNLGDPKTAAVISYIETWRHRRGPARLKDANK